EAGCWISPPQSQGESMTAIRWKNAGLAGALGVLLATPVAAQVCQGLPSFASRPVQVYGDGAFQSGSQLFRNGIAFGGNGPYWNMEWGATQIGAYNGTASEFGIGVGYQVPLDDKGSAQLCPTAGSSYLNGPRNVNGSGLDYSETHH